MRARVQEVTVVLTAARQQEGRDMNTTATPLAGQSAYHSSLTPLALTIDRWIYVFMASWFIAIVLTGFIPDSLVKIAQVNAGERAPFPVILHVHAVLMGSFLLLLLAQAALVATGRQAFHQRLGIAGVVIAAGLVVAGFLLVPTTYRQLWDGMQAAPPAVRSQIQQGLLVFDNIMLVQIRVGILFTLLVGVAVYSRWHDSELHKRLMYLAVAIALPAAFDRITWAPTTLPGSPLSMDLYVLLAVAPMFAWDVVRTRTVHRAYVLWLALNAPFVIATYLLWDSAWWHATARKLMGVG
jgi:hypothetical protein